MSFLQIPKIAVLAFIATGIVSTAITSANAADRNCSYEIRTKADGISSFTIPNGNIHFKGRARNTNNNRGFARFHAADGAMQCLQRAIGGRPLPANCRPGANLRSNTPGIALNFNVPRLKTLAYDALCHTADRARINSVRNAQIYTFVKGSSRDVRRECALPANARNVPRD